VNSINQLEKPTELAPDIKVEQMLDRVQEIHEIIFQTHALQNQSLYPSLSHAQLHKYLRDDGGALLASWTKLGTFVYNESISECKNCYMQPMRDGYIGQMHRLS